MPCTAGCRCSCGQQACGCHETRRRVRDAVRQPVCTACGTVLVSRDVTTEAGAPVRMALCPRCDLHHR